MISRILEDRAERRRRIEAKLSMPLNTVVATSFADPADIARFLACKEQGGTDKHCFAYGDNGIGCWGDPTVKGSGPSCALPPEDWKGLPNPRRARVFVRYNGRWVICLLKDTMPHKQNIKNGAGIDLNPDACEALGLKPPMRVEGVEWVFLT